MNAPCDVNEDGSSPFRFIEFTAYILFGLGPFVGNAVLTLLGAVSSSFLVDPTAVLVALPAFMFPFAIFQLFSGAISDIYGRVQVIVAGLIIFIVGLFLISFSVSIEMFALGNLVAGVGFGFVNPVLLALLSDCAGPEDIPKRMGIAAGLASLGVGLGPFFAGVMVRFGWQYYYMIMLVLVVFGLISISTARRPEKRTHGETGVRALASHLRIELRKPVVLLMLVSTFVITISYLGTMVWTSRGLTGVIDETLIGLILLGGGVFGGTAGLSLGRLIRFRGSGFSMLIGSLALYSSLLILIVINISLPSSVPIIAVAIALVGFAGGILFPLMIAFSQVLSPERRGVLAGAITFSSFFGVALIPSIYEPLFEISMTSVYTGILVLSLLLLVFLPVLNRKVSLTRNINDS
ncbi:MAG: MFS transporter [Promethearchaeota archaeon]